MVRVDSSTEPLSWNERKERGITELPRTTNVQH
jgi:hypothetical protein